MMISGPSGSSKRLARASLTAAELEILILDIDPAARSGDRVAEQSFDLADFFGAAIRRLGARNRDAGMEKIRRQITGPELGIAPRRAQTLPGGAPPVAARELAERRRGLARHGDLRVVVRRQTVRR